VNDLGGAAEGSGADEAPAQAVVDEIEDAGGTASANFASVSSWEGAQSLVEQAVDDFGRLDVLINNAGILRDRMSFNMDEADWDAVVDVHLKGHFCTSRFAAAHWRKQSKEQGGPVNAAIVNTASESGLYGNAGQVNYASAKAGIAAMTIVLARELERIGVRVNAICPVARTRLTEEVPGASDYMAAKESEFDRFAPENAAAAACWLASDLAAPISGQVVKVQGGVVQLVQGWHPVTEATDEKAWTIESLDARRSELFAKSGEGVPPFAARE
jgi:NAD(P)-dependent dehydrogenase (short-subunit alcohol dehydrogenase family)